MSVLKRAAAIAALTPALGLAQSAQKPALPVTDIRTEQLATLEFPWGMAALPDGRLLITEKPGRLRIFSRWARLVATN